MNCDSNWAKLQESRTKSARITRPNKSFYLVGKMMWQNNMETGREIGSAIPVSQESHISNCLSRDQACEWLSSDILPIHPQRTWSKVNKSLSWAQWAHKTATENQNDCFNPISFGTMVCYMALESPPNNCVVLDMFAQLWCFKVF